MELKFLIRNFRWIYGMRLSKEVSDRIAMLRPLLIIGVVFVHIQGISDVPSEIGVGVFEWIAAFFKNGFFRATVPTMSLISGFLLFSSDIVKYPRRLFEKKFSTLVIPFLIFNLYALGVMSGMNLLFDNPFPRISEFLVSPARFAGVFLA